MAAVADGRPPGARPPLPDLEPLAPEALVVSAVRARRLEAASALAGMMSAAGHPLGPLYAAALAFDRGEEDAARARAAESRVPLGSRGLGARLRHALEARDAGAALLLLDRRGELLATAAPSRPPEPVAAASTLLAGVLERLPSLPESGAVRLTIDLDLAALAARALGERRGSIVLVCPRSGAVLAAASDARTVAAEGAAAFTQHLEPASIAKVVTAAAAYRAGIDADGAIARMTCSGVERFGGQPLWCAWPAGPLEGLDHALALSCNVAFASLGVPLGAGRLLDEHRRWGFDAGDGALLGAAGRVHTPPGDPRQLADLAVGLTLADITPLHAALLAVVAVDGRLPDPKLLVGPTGGLGLEGEPLPVASGREVLDRGLARRLRRAMEAVTVYGTGTGLAPSGFPVAMKTGTAAEPGRGYHVNYIGLGPLPDPAVAFCVRVTNERSSRAVTLAAREVTGRLLAGLADRRGRLHGPEAVRVVDGQQPR